jgi:hypothetical protein
MQVNASSLDGGGSMLQGRSTIASRGTYPGCHLVETRPCGTQHALEAIPDDEDMAVACDKPMFPGGPLPGQTADNIKGTTSPARAYIPHIAFLSQDCLSETVHTEGVCSDGVEMDQHLNDIGSGAGYQCVAK